MMLKLSWKQTYENFISPDKYHLNENEEGSAERPLPMKIMSTTPLTNQLLSYLTCDSKVKHICKFV
jgi:hypothetical protein